MIFPEVKTERARTPSGCGGDRERDQEKAGGPRGGSGARTLNATRASVRSK
jgi:hypothetical protein